EQPIEPPDAIPGVLPGGNIRPGDQVARLLDDERAVHQEQRLVRHRGGVPLRTGAVWAGEIEHAEQTGQILAIDEAVDGAPVRERGRGQFDRSTPLLAVEPSGDGEDRVAQLLEVEPSAIHPAQEAVLRVPAVARRAGLTAL